MQVRYVYSACVTIDTVNVTILCDPWFTQGIYDGSWFQYPRLLNPIETIGRADLVYISHIHPDHYDPRFLSTYLARFPQTRLIIGRSGSPHLAHKMKLDGFAAEAIDSVRIGNTELTIIPNAAYAVNVDTALVVRTGNLSVVNMNDNPLDPEQIARVRALCPGGRPDFALLPYAGAGPYPQTFTFRTEAALIAAAEKKRRRFLDLYREYIRQLDPVCCMPFAGKYYLGGRLSKLNHYRGVADAVEVLPLEPRSIVLADGGQARYDLTSRTASALRTEPYSSNEISDFLADIEAATFDYEKELDFRSRISLPFLPLLNAAKEKARKKVRLSEPYWLCIQPNLTGKYFVFNVASDEAVKILGTLDDSLTPRAEIQIDQRYLFGLLTRLYHWNNAEIGSHYRTNRVPDIFIREVYDYLDILQV